MKRKINLTMLVVLMMVSLTHTEYAWGATTSFSVIDLGTLGGTESQALDVNIHGEVVGWSLNAAGDDRAFLWLPMPAYGLPAGMNDLGMLPTGIESRALGINIHGQVTGWSRIEDPNDPKLTVTRAFLWENGVMTNLGVPDGGSNSVGIKINEHGQVAGVWSSGMFGLSLILLWLPEAAYGLPAGANDLGGFLASTTPGNINSLGQIAGGTFIDTGLITTFLWLPSPAYGLAAGLHDLGRFGGQFSSGHSINDQGQMVGWWRPSVEFAPRRGFLWENGLMTDLGTFDEVSTSPRDINRWSQIVGRVSGSINHAILWEEGQWFDLNDLIPSETGWELHFVETINDLAQIAGYGTINGEKHAFLLNAIPPPIPAVSTYGLIILAIVLLIVGTIIIQRKLDLTNQI